MYERTRHPRLSQMIRERLSVLRDFIETVLIYQTHPHTVLVVRGVISLWVIISTLLLLPAAEHFWSFGSYIPPANVESLSYFQRSLNLLSYESVARYFPIFIIGQLVAAVLAGFSVSPRLSSALLYFFTLNLDNRAAVTMDGGNNLIHILLFLLVFIAPTSKVGVTESELKSNLKMFGNALSNMVFFMARVQIALLYATAGLLKVKGDLWPKGVALYYTMNVLEYGNAFVANLMSEFPLLLAFSCLMTVLFQVSFPILVWPRLTRPVVMAVGTIFHLSIIVVMGLTTFGLAMCASYFFFYTDSGARSFLATLWPRSGVSVAFDENCSICQRFARIVRFFDWRGLITQDHARNPIHPRLVEVGMHQRLSELHVANGDMTVAGYDAIVAILWRLPIVMPFVPLMRFIGFVGIGDWVYTKVASNSGWRKECQSGHCSIT